MRIRFLNQICIYIYFSFRFVYGPRYSSENASKLNSTMVMYIDESIKCSSFILNKGE